ncbi:MAG: redoxin domain-containing protein [Candidatus Poribacteria bacterium]|nr:redoxin domain-containing protein [Candidatus Poribacteria bacterium]
MRKMILRLKIFHLSKRTITLLFATLLITLSTQLAPRADTSHFLLSGDDFKDLGSLAVKLQDPRAVISQHIVPQLSAETQQLLGEYDGISSPSLALQRALILDLNKILQVGPLYDAESFTKIELSEQTDGLLAQNPQSGEALVRLNRLLLSDAYPHEVASLTEKQTSENPEGIEKCRENLRRIQQAREKYRDGTNRDPQWLSELSPEYLDKKDLLCPADATNGKPGVLTEGAEDPTLPCSYLYEFRPSQKTNREIILANQGDMLPFVRCERHLLNLSVGGKLYRNGPQREIYKGKMKVMVAQVNASGDLYTQLQAQLGEEFLKSREGKDLLKNLHGSLPPSTPTVRQEQISPIGKPMPNMTLTDLSGQPVKLEAFQSEFILLNIFPITSDTCGPKLKRLEKLLKNYDASQLQVVGISTDDSAKAIETFKEKYGLSMPIWMGKNMQMQVSVYSDISKSQAQLTTFLLNRELIVKDMVIDFDPDILSQKVKRLVESKN